MAVSEHEDAVSPVHEEGDHARDSVSPDPRPTRATRRDALLEQERRVLGEERRLRDKGAQAVDRMRGSTAGSVWTRLNAVDFMNSSLQFAALAVLCLFPFLIIVSAESGGDARHELVARLGLDQQATRDLNQLMSSGRHAVTTLSTVDAVFIVLGAIGIASTLQVWYQRVYEQQPANRWSRQVRNRLIWLIGLVLYLSAQDFFWTNLKHVGAKVPVSIITFILVALFYWWTAHVLLLGRVAWRQLIAPGVATALCITGLGVFPPFVLWADCVQSAGLRLDRRGYGAVVLFDRAWRLPPSGCGCRARLERAGLQNPGQLDRPKGAGLTEVCPIAKFRPASS
jgi:membrane protein